MVSHCNGYPHIMSVGVDGKRVTICNAMVDYKCLGSMTRIIVLSEHLQ
jgi:hypothetical protein